MKTASIAALLLPGGLAACLPVRRALRDDAQSATATDKPSPLAKRDVMTLTSDDILNLAQDHAGIRHALTLFAVDNSVGRRDLDVPNTPGMSPHIALFTAWSEPRYDEYGWKPARSEHGPTPEALERIKALPAPQNETEAGPPKQERPRGEPPELEPHYELPEPLKMRLPQSYDMSCFDDHAPVEDLDDATRMLAGACEAGMRTNSQSASKWTAGSANAHVCATGYGAQPCSAQEVKLFFGVLDAYCGPTGLGNIWIPDWAKTYGRDMDNRERCNLKGSWKAAD